MSRYNPETGIYGLTATKAEYWSGEDRPMSHWANLLKTKGLEVTKVRTNFLEVRANEENVKQYLTKN